MIMPERLKHHFEPKKGWMNDPNGLCYYKGEYHAFFQHNPFAPHWDRMHWGHASGRGLLELAERQIALYPDMPYENDGGCFSGSAIEADGRLWLFYTSVSKELGQTQSVAYSSDGYSFEKYGHNPVIRENPDGGADFRDPKVGRCGGFYYMVCGSGKDGVGKVLLFRSHDLLNWEYGGVLFEDASCGPVLECPDLFPLDGRWVLMFSMIGRERRSTQFVVGDFDGERFTERSRCTPEEGPHFYAPQTFEAPDGRRILFGWLYSWSKKLDEGADYAGALTIPRELYIKGDTVRMRPAREAEPLLADSDPCVSVDGSVVSLSYGASFDFGEPVGGLRILRDTKTIEIFADNGRSATYWFGSGK
jgi:sucrose-6-phosphate hydrolase SacC (GH32 family)